jgi:hypothetical protein
VHNSKPIQILQKLTNSEWKKLEDFLRSPVFNRNEKLIEFYEQVQPLRSNWNTTALERTHFFNMLFPGESFDDKKMRYLLSDFSKVLEDFLVWLSFREEPFQNDRLLLKSYQKRKLDKYFQATLSSVEKRLEEHPFRDAEYQGMRFAIEESVFQFNSNRKSHQTQTNLQQVVDSLDVYFLANKLRYSCEILNNRGVVNVEYDLFLLDEIQLYLQGRDLEKYPVIAIYHQILRTLREPDQTDHYYQLLQLLEEHRSLFKQNEIFDMYVYAKNYCIIKINKGHIGFTQELFEFYKIMLANGILIRDGQMTQWDFKNLVSLGLRLKEFDWTNDFMNENRDKIDPVFRDNVWRFNMANLYFHQGDYHRTLGLLQEVEFTDVYYHLDAKSLLLKTYYETREWDSLQSLIEAFKVYLKRNRSISGYQQTVYGNLVRFVHTLLRYQLGKKVQLEKLALDIEECREIANIIWLKAAVERERELATLNHRDPKRTGRA